MAFLGRPCQSRDRSPDAPPPKVDQPMSEQAIPAGTTLLLRGGRALLPDGDWHNPSEADIAIAGDTIAGVAPRYARQGGAGDRDHRRTRSSRAAGLHQRALPFARRAGERHARGGAARELAALRFAAAVPAAIARGDLRADAARRARMPAIGHDHHPGHADALSVRGSPSRPGDGGLRQGRHPRHFCAAIR